MVCHVFTNPAYDFAGRLKAAPVVGPNDQRLQQAIARLGDESEDRKIPPPDGIDLQPVGVALPGPVWTVKAFRHDSLEALFSGGIEEGEAIVGDRLHDIDATGGTDRLEHARPAAEQGLF